MDGIGQTIHQKNFILIYFIIYITHDTFGIQATKNCIYDKFFLVNLQKS